MGKEIYELEVGMYVRTKDGIGKITSHEHYWLNGEEWNYIITDIGLDFEIDMILKASHNIIDLIEAGDYVNGLKVEKSKYGELYTSYTYMGGDIGLQQETYTTFLKDYEEDDVYSVLTREQFESMSYKVSE